MPRTAVIAGVGPGLGASLARRFAQEGCRVGLLARSAGYLQQLASEVQAAGQRALAVPTDLTDEEQVQRGFGLVREQLGPVDILVNHASEAPWKGLLEVSPREFEQAWRVTTYGAFLCCRAAVGDMVPRQQGVILFTGATSSVRGRAGAVAFSSAKFALRGLADSLARELWPQGIHVAHVVIDGVIDTPAVRQLLHPAPDEPLLDPDAIAQTYWALVEQKPGAWTFEVDVRPPREAFFV
ncbi:MAG: SDR family NAD(P)-dependent oxidoreductase [Candidatus Latescibacterota bacterium]